MIKKKPLEIQEWENEGGACKPTQISLDQIPMGQRTKSSLENYLFKTNIWFSQHPISYLIAVIVFGCACAILGSQCCTG